MNGIPAGMAGSGYSAYSPLAVPATYGTPEGNIAKSWLGSEPVPLAGDISALTSPEPVWFDVNAPLQYAAPEPVITSPLPVLSQFYASPAITTGGPVETVFPAEQLSWLDQLWDLPGNVAQWGIDATGNLVQLGVDVVKFVGENLEVGVKTGMEIGGAAAKYKTAEAQLKSAEAAQTLAKAQLLAAQRPVTPTITSNLADLLAKLASLAGVPPAATPPFVEAGTAMGGIGVEAPTNWLLLGALAIGAYLLLR